MINFLAGLGLIIFLCDWLIGPFVQLPPQVAAADSLAVLGAAILQTARGLAYCLQFEFVPKWFLLKRFDRKSAADSTVVFLLLFGVFSLALENRFDAYSEHSRQIKSVLATIAVFLFVWLSVLAARRSKVPSSIFPALVFAILAPCAAICGVHYMTSAYFHVVDAHDVGVLIASSFIAVLVSFSLIVFFDKRDVSKNLGRVIINQLVALPAIPLCYMVLQLVLPKNVNPFVVVVGLVICLVGPLAYWRTRRRPWRIKAKVDELVWSAPTRNLLELQAGIKNVLEELLSEKLILKDALDHNDRADCYRLLGELQTNLMQFYDAEKNYRAAIDCYNDALRLEPDNQIAISNKFKTVEAISDLQRTRF